MGLDVKKIMLGVIIFLFVIFVLPTNVSAASNKYNHLNIKIATNFSINQFENGKEKSTKINAKISDVSVKIDKKKVELKDGITYSDNSYIEYKSKAGYDNKTTLDFGEDSLLEICGKISYTHNNQFISSDFYLSKKTNSKNNECSEKKDSNMYGFDYQCSAKELQNIMNNSIVNISKKGGKTKNTDKCMVIIYQNDEKFRTVELNKDNNYKYSLVGLSIGELDSNEKWTEYKYRIEEIPSDSDVSVDINFNNEKNVFEIKEKQVKNNKKNENTNEKTDVIKNNSNEKDYFDDDYKYEEDEEDDSAWLGLNDKKENYTTATIQKSNTSPNTADGDILYYIVFLIISATFTVIYSIYFNRDKIKRMFTSK